MLDLVLTAADYGGRQTAFVDVPVGDTFFGHGTVRVKDAADQ